MLLTEKDLQQHVKVEKKNDSPVLSDQFLDEDVCRFWHPLPAAGERGMTSDER